MPSSTSPGRDARNEKARREAIRALRHAHEWLERVDEIRQKTQVGYIGLDHRLGENEDGCTLCHAAGALTGRLEPLGETDV